MLSTSPVPMAPSHKPVWRGLRRYCSCGLLWKSCPDRHVKPVASYRPAKPAWACAPTQPYPTFVRGRGPLGMTPAQEMRGRGAGRG